jgi:hypothetical protein
MKYTIHINLTENEKRKWEEFLSRPSKPGEEDRKQSVRIHTYRGMAAHLAGNRGGGHTPYMCIEVTSYIGEARAWKWLGSTAASESLAGPHVLVLPDEQEEYEYILFCNGQPITKEESND